MVDSTNPAVATIAGSTTGDALYLTGDGTIATTNGINLNLDSSGGKIVLSDVLNIGGATASFNFFTSGAPSGVDIADGAGDLFVGDELEVNGSARFDGAVTLGDAAGDGITLTGRGQCSFKNDGNAF